MISIRNTRPEDFTQIIELTKTVYPESGGWHREQLESHLRVFPEGQFVAFDSSLEQVLGFASSLIISWDDYDMKMGWRDFTDRGFFSNHDPDHGKTLYGADVIVDPKMQGHGIGKALYAARRHLVERLGLFRIRAGSRLQGYHQFANIMSAEEYVFRIVQGELSDPTLSFQLHQGFHVLAVVEGYLHHDPKSMGYAAVIEWMNERIMRPEDYSQRGDWISKHL